MEYPQFIIKEKKGFVECICQSLIYEQQISGPDKLILYVGEARDLNKFEKHLPLLFTRVGDESGNLYERFRRNTWYITEDYSFEKDKLRISNYKEHHSLWELMEKRINPLAVMIAAVVSAIITFAGVNLNSLITGNRQESRIQELEKQVHILQKLIKETSQKAAKN